jgi:hypothetical protein
MLTRTAMLALAGVLTFGAATLTTTSNADAHGWRHWHRYHGHVYLYYPRVHRHCRLFWHYDHLHRRCRWHYH